MKFKTTKKEMKNYYSKILSIGYCSLQSLLYYEDPIAYSSGSNGWSCDYYKFDNLIICTGYSRIGEEVNYDLVREYEKKANKLRDKCSWKKIDEKMKKLIKEFIKEVS